MRKLTKAHFNHLARIINKSFLGWEKKYLGDVDNELHNIVNFSWAMSINVKIYRHSTAEVQKTILSIVEPLYEEVINKKYEHFNHSFNCFMKRLCVELKKQNPKFVESKFREACTKGSIQ